MFPTRNLLGRSVWKGPNIVPLPLPRKLPPPPNTPPIRTQKRAATILPNFVGLRFAVHNGKTYQEIQITEEMVGRKLGEYVAYVCPVPALLIPARGLQSGGNSLHGWTRECLMWKKRYRRWSIIDHVTDEAHSRFSTRKRFTYKQSKNK
ncbi:37S ribosomal protein S19 [Penicillium diatomitis]|uniref:37S ribosomal protein S19 n=1 Tax=Penicillium diatomitis TaxID=2819901 RepID=A0A9W9XCS1_9EURO|nr:37S ribosomal protein S19 [Penicillium diatomitis]KAJ5488901.1 37S ribosomal protein S19 [Penicillium diatomitis]